MDYNKKANLLQCKTVIKGDQDSLVGKALDSRAGGQSKIWTSSQGLLHVFEIERFSYDLEMKTREQNRNNKRMEIEQFDWFIERIQTRVAFGWLSERSCKKTS